MQKVIALNEFIIQQQQTDYPAAGGNFSRLLHHIGIAAKKVNREVNKAGLIDILGKAGTENVQGEEQQKLDIYANETFMAELQASGECCGIASEENEDLTTFHEGLCSTAKYIVCMDPLDGSSNIDVNVSVGTIFSIYRRKSPIGTPATPRGFPPERHRHGGCRLCHLRFLDGIGLYGRQRRERLHARPVDRRVLPLAPPTSRPPAAARSTRSTRATTKSSDGRQEIHQVLPEKDTATNRPYTSRYIGSLVADFHRNMLKGGSSSTRRRTATRTASSACCTNATRSPSSPNRPAEPPSRTAAVRSTCSRKPSISAYRSTSVRRRWSASCRNF